MLVHLKPKERKAKVRADIARRMAQQYSQSGDVSESIDPIIAQEGGESAADIARRMAQQYSGDSSDFTPIPDQTAPYEPVSSELAQKFIESQQQVPSFEAAICFRTT